MATLIALTADPRAETWSAQTPSAFPECTGISATLSATTPEVSRGHKPEFALTLSTTGARPMRVLDVRQGRRPDLQDSYFELVVLQRGRPVETPVAISDPGPVSASDFFDLRPGERTTLQHLSYTRALNELRPGEYEAVVLIWRNPMKPTTRCRSKVARFTVKK
jgi:hypothetical protein